MNESILKHFLGFLVEYELRKVFGLPGYWATRLHGKAPHSRFRVEGSRRISLNVLLKGYSGLWVTCYDNLTRPAFELVAYLDVT